MSARLSPLLCAAVGTVAVAATAWGSESSLWITAEQRAQELLDAGRPLAAAPLFNDRKRRAYAYALAGRYERAASLLAPLHDVDSEFNRGNALARSGRLLEALSAYNSALRQAPGDDEVRHNRDLVAHALEDRAAQSPQSSAPGADQHGAQSDSSGGSAQDRVQQSARGPKAQAQSGTPAGASAEGGGTATADDLEQAKRDADLGAALGHAAVRASQRAGSAADDAKAGGSASGAAVASDADLSAGRPESEQALALEQWLRRIPDDPGGLLRRKFLIEHIARHQGAEP